MIDIINDNFNDLAKDYYKLQEEYEQLEQENKQLKERIDKTTEYIEYKKNETKEEIVKLKNNDDFYNYFKQKLNIILEILGDKENE